jgi:hypothetical protein
VRGQAYLQARQGREAAAEFQKILDQSGLVLNGPIVALSRAELARAYALQAAGSVAPAEIHSVKALSTESSASADDDPKAKARAQYEAFFTLWKEADPGIPVLKEAKAAYAKLK